MAFTPTQEYFVDANGQVWAVSIGTDGAFVQTPVSFPPPTPPNGYTTTTAEQIIDAVIQDAQRESTNRVAVLDYVNRICQRILRDTQWAFLRSAPQRFITQPGSTDYFIGTGNAPSGSVPTGLNLPDVFSVWTESVFDKSHNDTQLLMNPASTVAQTNMSFQDGKSRPGIPRSFKYEITNPNVISIYPYADNKNTYQPVPLSPVCTSTAAGALGSRLYYVYSTFVDDQGNESSSSVVPTTVYVPAGSTLIAAPPIAEVASAQQISYTHWNCYVGTTVGTAYKQNATPLATTSVFAEPTSGPLTNTATLPTENKLAPLSGYIIEFRYFKQRTLINSPIQILQIPDYYADVVIAGTNWFYNLYMNNKEIDHMQKAMVWQREFLDGIRQIRKDLNISFRNTDFIGPDRMTQTNQGAGNASSLWGSI